MLVHRLRRWPNIETMSGERVAFARLLFQPLAARPVYITASPDGSFVPVVLRNSEVLGSNRGRVGFCHRGCAYAVPKLVKGVECAELSMVLCTMMKI